MRRPLLALPLALLVAGPVLAAPAALAAPTGAGAARRTAAAVTVTKRTLEFKTTGLGPNHDQSCNVEGDLYTPSTATAATPAPAILTTNGFGGNKDGGGATGNAAFAMTFAQQGYVTLSYSGLGFGGSGCQIELDDQDFDGLAGSQLISFLGGASGIGFTGYTPPTPPVTGTVGTYTGPVSIDYVQRDTGPAHDGAVHPNDPRVGSIGGSYGGQNQFAIAIVDPRLDTVIPQITWNDLSYSLAPNNATLAPGSVTYATPGVEKLDWVSLFFAVGLSQPVSSMPGTTVGTACPDFDSRACQAKAFLDATGYPDANTLDLARHASVSHDLDKIRIPVFLSQGESDTLFNLQEAAATYRNLSGRGLPVKMAWQWWGHSDGAPKPGELDATKAPDQTFLMGRYAAWFAKYLRDDTNADTGPAFEYFRDFVPYPGNGQPGTATAAGAQSAYAGAASYPVGTTEPLYLSGAPTGDGSGALVRAAPQVTTGNGTFTTSPDTTTSFTEISAVNQTQPVTDMQGTFAGWASPPLAHDADLVGVPSLDVRLSFVDPADNTAATTNPAAGLVVFAKLYDVAPDGTITLPHRLIAPVRVQDLSKPVHIELPGIVHRVPAGHHLEVVLAQGDTAYKGNNAVRAVQVATSAASPSLLTLPVAQAGDVTFAADGPMPVVPETPWAALLPLAALAVGGGVLLRRRRALR